MVGTRANQTVRSGRISESDRPIARSGSIWSGPRPLPTDRRSNSKPDIRIISVDPEVYPHPKRNIEKDRFILLARDFNNGLVTVGTSHVISVT